MRDKLDQYRHILGSHAERIEEQAEPLAEQRLGHDPEWYRKERGKRGDPFAKLERIVVDAQKHQLEYASRRVAIAEVREELAAKGVGPPLGEGGSKEEMLAEYRRTFGDRAATSIATRAKEHGPVLRQKPEWLEARARKFAAPHPPRAEFDQKVSEWARDDSESATELLALERAEQRTVELEGAKAVEAAEPRLGGGAVEWLSGPEINQRIERRKQELVPEFEEMSRRELTDEGKKLEADLYERGRELYEKAAQLEEGAPPFAPPGGPSQQTAEQAHSTRQQVREAWRWQSELDDVQGRWVDLHAREAALQLVSERGLSRSREPEGMGY